MARLSSGKLTRFSEREASYSDGSFLFREGEAGTEMFIIQEGAVRVTKRAGTDEIHLATLSRGDFLGEMSLLEGLPRDADARAVGQTQVLQIGQGGLLMRIRRDPTFALELQPVERPDSRAERPPRAAKPEFQPPFLELSVIIDVAEERLVIVSDLHLGNPASRAASSFPSFLDYVRDEGLTLCLNGDSVEMLQTRLSRIMRDAVPLMTQISRMCRDGQNVYYIVGNHDIYVEHFLDEWFVLQVCPFLNVFSGGKRIRVEHGHLYDPAFLRAPKFYESLTRLSRYMLFVRPDIYQMWDPIVARLNQRLRRKPQGSEDSPIYHAAAAEVLTRGFDAVVYGHTHHAEIVEFDNGLYLNSGCWMHGGTFVEIDSGRVELKTWL